MDWKYKHFNQQAIFNASIQDVIEAARAVAAESFEGIEDAADGFVARGYSAFHSAIATFRISSAPGGTQLSVELLVERAAMRGYMLVDIGGYYNGQIDKWFTAIAQRLGGAEANAMVSKTTSGMRVQRGCLAGCLAWLLAAVCLGTLGTALDRTLFPQGSAPLGGPFGIALSTIALVLGVGVFLYFVYPDGSISKFVRGRLQGKQEKGKGER